MKTIIEGTKRQFSIPNLTVIFYAVLITANLWKILLVQIPSRKIRLVLAIFIIAVIFFGLRWLIHLGVKKGFISNKSFILSGLFSSAIVTLFVVRYARLLTHSFWADGLSQTSNLIKILDVFALAFIGFWILSRLDDLLHLENQKGITHSPKFQEMFRSNKFQTGIFILFCLLVAFLQIGDFQGRLGSVHGDDGPSIYSYYFAHPENYADDILATYGNQQIYATLQNFIPAYLYKYLNVSPAISSIVQIFLQYLLLGLSIRYLTKVITGHESAGWMATLIVFGSNPWDWNLANYGNVMFIPYAGHLVMPFLLFYFGDILRGKNSRSQIWLFLAGLIHPTLALYAAGITVLFWLYPNKLVRKKSDWLLLGLVILTIIIPRLLLPVLFNHASTLTFEEMKPALMTNIHLSPLHSTLRVKSFLLFIPLLGLSLRGIRNIRRSFSSLIVALLIATLGCFGLYWLAWKFEILTLIQFGPLRISSLLVFITLPLVASYLVEKTRKSNLLGITFAILFTSLLIWSDSFSSSVFFKPEYGWWLGILLCLDILDGYIGPMELPPQVKTKLGSIFHNNKIPEIKTQGITVFLLVGLMAMTGITIRNSILIGEPTRTIESQDGYAIQKWVSQNTPEGSMVMDLSRSISQRASIKSVQYNWYVYNRSRECKAYIDRVNAFFEPYIQQEGFIQGIDVLDEEGTLRFAHEFQVDYVLRTVDTPLALPAVYQNSTYILYSIPN